jgi:hypothetical protein
MYTQANCKPAIGSRHDNRYTPHDERQQFNQPTTKKTGSQLPGASDWTLDWKPRWKPESIVVFTNKLRLVWITQRVRYGYQYQQLDFAVGVPRKKQQVSR